MLELVADKDNLSEENAENFEIFGVYYFFRKIWQQILGYFNESCFKSKKRLLHVIKESFKYFKINSQNFKENNPIIKAASSIKSWKSFGLQDDIEKEDLFLRKFVNDIFKYPSYARIIKKLETEIFKYSNNTFENN